MLMTIAIILAVLWALGFFAVHIGGAVIHILLIVALLVVIYDKTIAKQSA